MYERLSDSYSGSMSLRRSFLNEEAKKSERQEGKFPHDFNDVSQIFFLRPGERCRDEEDRGVRVKPRLNTPYPYVIVFATFLLFLEAVASCFLSMEPRRETDLEDVYRWTLRRSSMRTYSRCTRDRKALFSIEITKYRRTEV